MPDYPRYPNEDQQADARQHLTTLPPARKSPTGGPDHAGFEKAASALLAKWYDSKVNHELRVNPIKGELDSSEIDDLHGIGTGKVTEYYGKFLNNAHPKQSVLPSNKFHLIRAGDSSEYKMCSRMYNLLESENVFVDYGMTPASNTVKRDACNLLVSQYSPNATLPTLPGGPASDHVVATSVIGNFLYSNIKTIAGFAELEPGYTAIDPDSGDRDVYIQAQYSADSTGDPSIDQIKEKQAHAERRWKALMTVVHEIIHTLQHPRFGALLESGRVKNKNVGTEGVTEYLAYFVKKGILAEVRGNKDFAAHVNGGTGAGYQGSQHPLKSGYSNQVKPIIEMVDALSDKQSKSSSAMTVTDSLSSGGSLDFDARPGTANLSYAYFRGWLDYIGFDNSSESEAFGGKTFSHGELGNYLDDRDGGSIGLGIRSDDKARAIVDDWRRGVDPEQGTSFFALTTEQKQHLLRQMLYGVTNNRDERAIIAILEHSSPDEWRQYFSEDGGVEPRRLVRKFQRQRGALERVVRQQFGIDLQTFKRTGVS